MSTDFRMGCDYYRGMPHILQKHGAHAEMYWLQILLSWSTAVFTLQCNAVHSVLHVLQTAWYMSHSMILHFLTIAPFRCYYCQRLHTAHMEGLYFCYCYTFFHAYYIVKIDERLQSFRGRLTKVTLPLLNRKFTALVAKGMSHRCNVLLHRLDEPTHDP